MDAINAGKCPTVACPKDRCARPGLSPRERDHTHAINRDKRARARGARIRPGISYFVVRLSGKLEHKILGIPDVRSLPVSKAESLANDAIDALRERVKKDRMKDARRGRTLSAAKSREIESHIDDAFDAGEWCVCVSEQQSP
jgi:hypothetical protein